MLDYEWTNTSSMLLTGEEPAPDSDQTRQIFDQYNNPGLAAAGNYIPSVNTYAPNYHHPFQQENHPHFYHQPLFESSSRAYAYPSYPPPPSSNLTLEPISGATDFMITKNNEEVYGATAAMDYSYSTRIGLNLGGRTYFSSDDDFVNRLYRRSRTLDAGPANTPRCQAEGCNADLTHSKHYHRRHKVCEFHSKAATVLISGLTQRFCQQCSRFHLLAEFDQGKRSCRKRLADHNRRRRKSQPQQQKQQLDNDVANSPISDQNPVSRSSPESAARSSSSVTIAMSPPAVCLGSFRSLTDGQASVASSPSTSSLSRW